MSPRKATCDSKSKVSEKPPQPESSIMYDEVKHHERKPGRAVILVANGQNFSEITGKCKKIQEARKKDKNPFRLTVILPEYLQTAVNDILEDETRKYLAIIVSHAVEEIMFHVSEPRIKTLRIQRCRQEKDAHPQLTLNGMSTYVGTRVDEWQSRPNEEKREFFLGENVIIKPDIRNSPSWKGSSGEHFSKMDGREEQLHQHFDYMNRTPINAPNWWELWSGCIGGILGLAAGSPELVAGIKATTKGIYLQYQFGIRPKGKSNAGSAKPTMVTSAAGPATLLCLGVAATIYFVPWDSVYSWLTDAFSWLWKKIVALWQKFKNFMASVFSKTVPKVPHFARSESI
ncbi:hypothetical protein N431DRAFT_473762 [Stipitochalara longipes BDJ]|nr:hypothetical protein N431DRAFT_473762 [Stipitochalara longipes BDJ]